MLLSLLRVLFQCQHFLPGLLPLAAGDQAQLVRQQLNQFQDRVKLTESQVACAQQKLLFAQRPESSKSSPPAGLEAQLEPEGSASVHPEPKALKQVFVSPLAPGRRNTSCPLRRLYQGARVVGSTYFLSRARAV